MRRFTTKEWNRNQIPFVQVMLFADRLEVWNPGELPPPLTLEKLRKPHASIPHNPLIAEPMFLATYAEKAGSGILDMMRLSRQAGLRAPAFRQDAGQFVQTLWRPKQAAGRGLDEPTTEQVPDKYPTSAFCLGIQRVGIASRRIAESCETG